MKIRHCFVSNSSSSSFVVHESQFKSSKQFNDVMEGLATLEESLKGTNYEGNWGENGRTWDTEDGYLIVECHYVEDKISKVFKDVGVDIDKLKKIWVE